MLRMGNGMELDSIVAWGVCMYGRVETGLCF